MALSEMFSNVYAKLEDGFFSILDFLESKGIPVYFIVTPLEEKGLPVFPVTLAAIALICALVFGFVFIGFSYPEVTVTFEVKDDYQRGLNNVKVTLKDAEDRVISISPNLISNGEQITLQNIPKGAVLFFIGEKEGYGAAQFRAEAISESINVILLLEKEIEGAVGKIKLVDIETETAIEDAQVVATLIDHSTRVCNFDSENIYFVCNNIIKGEETLLQINASNYEQLETTVTFDDDGVKEIELYPDAMALFGESNLIIRVRDYETKSPLGDVKIQIYDTSTDELLNEVVDEDGEFLDLIEKGTIVRIVVSKQGYIKFDSAVVEDFRTMRDEEEIWNVDLYPGGLTVTVNVLGKSDKLPVSNATVMLFDNLGELIETQMTAFGGFVEFENLQADLEYYATAIAELYLPSRAEILPQDATEYNLEIERELTTNSSDVEIITVDTRNRIINDATIQFFEVAGDKSLPLGIPNQKTDINGKLTVRVENGKKIKVAATKGTDYGDAVHTVQAGEKNQIIIYMAKKAGIVKLTLFNEDGNPILDGNVLVRTASGDILFSDEVPEDGEIYFDGSGLTTVELTYTDKSGNVYTEEVDIQGKEDVEVTVFSNDPDKLSPEIEFLGVFDASGREVQGITKGEDYYLKFRTGWPLGMVQGGIHVRVGSDDIKYADSDDVGIVGFKGVSARAVYGRTYSPYPSPGLEIIDFQNRGSVGSLNKWVELYFGKSSGTKIVSVRVQAKENTPSDNFEVHYRAWVVANSQMFRNPQDDVLLFDAFSTERSQLYADTHTKEVKVFDGRANCQNEICASFKFVRQDGSEFEAEEFAAANNELYALEVELNPLRQVDATIKASTSKTNPKLFFTGYGIDSFSGFPDNNNMDTSIEVTNVAASIDDSARVRLYFKTQDTENSFINLQIITDETVMNETFNFVIYVEKNIVMETIPEVVTVGKDFTIVVKDEDEKPISDATIKLKDTSGRLLETIIGSSTSGKGVGGNYSVHNTFDAGTLKVEITSKHTKPYRGTIEITKEGVLAMPKEVVIYIPKDGEEARVNFSVENTSEDTVTNVEYEIIRSAGWASEFDASVAAPLTLRPHTKEKFSVSATYDGEKERDHAEARIVVRGNILGKYSVRAETKLVVEYNQQLAQECLEFSKENMEIYLLSDEGSTKSETVTAKNNCHLPLNFVAEAVPRGHNEGNIKIEINEITLNAVGEEGDTATVDVLIINELVRQYPNKKTLKYDIVFRSDALTKSLPLNIIIWDKRFALQMNRNIEVYVAEQNPEDLPAGMPPGFGHAVASVPLFIKNVGEADIENITLAVSNAYRRGNVDLAILPTSPVAVLKKGATVTPPKWVIVRGLRTGGLSLPEYTRTYNYAMNRGYEQEYPRYNYDSGGSYNYNQAGGGYQDRHLDYDLYAPQLYGSVAPIEYSEVNVKGTIDGREYDFGPIAVTVHISAASCLKIAGKETPIDFTSPTTKATILTETVTIINTCAEPVVLGQLNQPRFGRNWISVAEMSPIMPSEHRPVQLKFHKNSDWTAPPTTVFFHGFLTNSGKWITSEHFTIQVAVGLEGIETGEAASQEVEVPVCDEAGTMRISFPIIETSGNCDKAYCDAEALAKYLTNRIAEKVRDAKNQVLRYGQDARKTRCDVPGEFRAYCTFSDLGVVSRPFYVYMQHDQMSDSMLKDALNKDKELAPYKVDRKVSAAAFYATIGNIPHKVVLTGDFRGCGRYLVRIDGIVRMDAGKKLIPDFISVLVDLNPLEEVVEGQPVAGAGTLRQKTDQCEHKIQNVMNFLPVDPSYGRNNTAFSWLGMVKSEGEDIEAIGEEFAKELFGKKERYVAAGTAMGNELTVRYGEVEGALVKLKLESGTYDSPKTVVAEIKESTDVESLQADIAKESAQAVADLRSNKLGSGACISRNEDFFRLRSTREIGEITIDEGQKKKIGLIFGKANCYDFNVLSNLDEAVIPEASLASERIGTSIPWIEYKGKKLGKDEAVSLEHDYRKKIYTQGFQVCIQGEQEMQLAIGRQIVLNAKSKDDPLRKAEEKVIEMEICGIHPYDVYDAINAKKEAEGKTLEEYYATVSWSNPPDKIRLQNIIGATRIKRVLGIVKETIADPSAIEQPEYEKKVRSYKLKGLGIYAGVCGGTALFFGSLFKLGPWGGVMSVIFDCGIPATYAAMNLFDAPKQAIDWVKDRLKGVFGLAKSGLGGSYTELGDATGAIIPESARETVGEYGTKAKDTSKGLIDSVFDALFPDVGHEQTNDVMKVAAMQGVAGGAFTGAWGSSVGYVSPASAKTAANGMAKAMVDSIKGSKYSDMPLKMKSAMRSEIAEKIEKELSAHYGKRVPLHKVLRESTEKAITNIGTDPVFAEKFLTLGTLNDPDILKTAQSKVVGGYLGDVDSISKSIGDSAALDGFHVTNTSEAINESARKIMGDIESRFSSQIDEAAGARLPVLQQANPAATIGDARNVVLSEIDSTVRANVSISGSSPVKVSSGFFGGETIQGYTVKINAGSAKNAANAGIRHLESQFTTNLPKGLEAKVANEVMQNFTKEAEGILEVKNARLGFKGGTTQSYKIKWGKLKSLVRGVATRGFWWGLAKGTLAGIIANVAGLGVRAAYIEATPRPDVDIEHRGAGGNSKDDDGDGKIDEEWCDGIDNDGDGRVDEDCKNVSNDIDIIKNETYKITVEKREGYRMIADWEQVLDLKKIPDDAKFIEACDQSYWEDKERGGRDVREIYIRLIPNLSRLKKSEYHYVERYITNFAEHTGRAAVASKIQEELLVALGIWKSKLEPAAGWAFGCDTSNQAAKNIAENSSCAARMLKKSVAACGVDDIERKLDNADLKCVLEKYNEFTGAEREAIPSILWRYYDAFGYEKIVSSAE